MAITTKCTDGRPCARTLQWGVVENIEISCKQGRGVDARVEATQVLLTEVTGLRWKRHRETRITKERTPTKR